MEKFENTSSAETTSDFIIEMMLDEEDGEEFTREFLKAKFLNSAVHNLYNIRRKAGLTQEQLAQKLGKKQSAIARWEADVEGRISLRQYVEIAQACGVSPFALAFESLEALRNFIFAHPEVLPTQEIYQTWVKKMSEPLHIPPLNALEPLTAQTIAKAALPTNTTLPNHEGKQAVRFAEQLLREQKLASDDSYQLPKDTVTNMSPIYQTLHPRQMESKQNVLAVHQEKVVA